MYEAQGNEMSCDPYIAEKFDFFSEMGLPRSALDSTEEKSSEKQNNRVCDTVNANSDEIGRTASSLPRTVYTIEDWLRLHRLSTEICQKALRKASGHRIRVIVDEPSPMVPLSAIDAWVQVAIAFKATFPAASQAIDRTLCETLVVFNAPRGRPPFTLPLGSGGRAKVSLSYLGRASDLLTVAHEFGHALQLQVCAGRFLPPANRELAAFVGELALLGQLKGSEPDLFRAVAAAWHRANRTYLGSQARALATALADPTSRYEFAWNYPIARMLASFAFERGTALQSFGQFCVWQTIPRLIDEFVTENQRFRQEDY